MTRRVRDIDDPADCGPVLSALLVLVGFGTWCALGLGRVARWWRRWPMPAALGELTIEED